MIKGQMLCMISTLLYFIGACRLSLLKLKLAFLVVCHFGWVGCISNVFYLHALRLPLAAALNEQQFNSHIV